MKSAIFISEINNLGVFMKIERSKDPYELDHILLGKQTIAALTRKNADFIEAVVRLDSNYGKDKTEDWFKKMLNGGDFKECLSEAIVEIDKINSTHLEAGVDGRNEMVKRVLSLCENVEDLKRLLLKTFSANDEEHILYKLTDKIKAKNRDGYRYNLSFATKFCSYASQFLELGDNYSKYDSVVAKCLPLYSECYLKEKTAKKHFLVKQHKNDLESRLSLYATYSNCINRIMALLEADNITLTRSELDHIIWYCFK